MRKNPFFPIDDFVFEPDDEFFEEITNMLATRSVNTNYPILSVFKKMGKLADAILKTEDSNSTYKDLFLINFAILSKFLYPLHEQMDAIIDNHLKVSVGEK